MLNIGLNTARDGLAELGDTGWMMSLPRQDPCSGRPGEHPAGRGLPGRSAVGRGAGTIVVTFGKLTVPAGAGALLPVRWESAEHGDEFAVLLDADIILSTAADQACILTLAGVCRLPPGTLIADGYELARAQVTEAAREFITSVADAVTCCGAQGQEPPTRGEARSWVTGVSRQQLPGGVPSAAFTSLRCQSPGPRGTWRAADGRSDPSLGQIAAAGRASLRIRRCRARLRPA
jgi:hypothetical protein